MGCISSTRGHLKVSIPILRYFAEGQISHIKSAQPRFRESTVKVARLAVNTLETSLVDTTTIRVGPSNQCIRVEGTTERPRLPTYIPTYLPAVVYLPTYLQPFRLSTSETASGGCWQQQHQQQAGSS